ncbi:MAG: hypothetical protein ACRDRL_27155 [Sciscionella sp.]
MTNTAMTNRVLSHYRRRHRVSLSAPPLPIEPIDPVEHLDHATEIIHRTNRALTATVPDHDELIALAGLLTQASDALLTLTDLLITSTSRRDRTPTAQNSTNATRSHATIDLLRDCRNSYLTARATAQALHAHLRCQATTAVSER